MRAGLYARVSREEQVDGYSIGEQIEAMRRFCAERDWTVAVEFVEPGFTARTDQRPVLSKVLRACEMRQFDVLVTHKLDRAFRSLLDQLQRLAQLTEWGVSYVSTVEQIDYSTPHGRMFMSMLGALNQYYSDNLSEEVRKGKRGRARAGRSNAPMPPFGYRRVDGDDLVDQDEAKTVRRLFELYVTGMYSYERIAGKLNREGRPVGERNRSGRWTWNGVFSIVRNLFYVGQVGYKGEVYPGLHEAIITEELWEQSQRARLARSKRMPRKGKHPHLLGGLLFCEACGSKLWAVAHPRRRYYMDSAKRVGVVCRWGGRHVAEGDLDEQVAGLVGRLRVLDGWRERLVELASEDEDRANAERTRRRLEGRMRRLRELYIEGDVEKGEYTARKLDLEEELLGVYLSLREAPVREAAETMETLQVAWEDAPVERRRQMLGTMVKRIYVDMETGRVVRLEPWPPFARLFELTEVSDEVGSEGGGVVAVDCGGAEAEG